MGHEEHRRESEKIGRVRFSIITISDRRSLNEDETGAFIRELLDKEKFEVIHHIIVRNSIEEIKRELMKVVNSDTDVIVTCGGTGVSKRDLTVEAIEPLLEKRLEGFGDIFRMLSYSRIGSAAIMTRATAGIIRDKVIFCLPGSPDAVEMAMKEIIIREVKHLIWEMRKDKR